MKEQIERDQERPKYGKNDDQVWYIVKKCDGLSVEKFKCCGYWWRNLDEAQCEALYNEEVNFLETKEEGFRPSCPCLVENSGWNRDDVLTIHYKERGDRNANLKEKDGK